MTIIRLALLQTAFLFAALLFPNTILAQQDLKPAINWLTFDQVLASYKENPKPLMVFFYKANDDSSKLLLNTTFTRKEVCVYTNTKYYPVKIDISSKADIKFMDGKVYKYNAAKQSHDLAILLLGEKPEAPTVLLFDDKNTPYAFKGYKNYNDMLCQLVYISENVQKTTRYNIWAPAYFRTFPPDQKVNRIPLAVNWLTLEEALKLNSETPKGIFLTFFTKSSAASSVMLVNAFSHKQVAKYLDENFYCVRLDAQTSDTLIWDKEYYNTHGTGNFHDLAKIMMKDQMQFPSIFFFDHTNRLILSENLYLSPEALYMLSNYVVSESYKTKAFADYIKTFKFEFQDIVPREFQNATPTAKP